MSSFHIHRNHVCGLKKIRKIAFTLAEMAEQEFGLSCVYQEGVVEDEVYFTRTGVKGLLLATHDTLDITIELDVFFRPFKSSMETEISQKLDLLLINPKIKANDVSNQSKRHG